MPVTEIINEIKPKGIVEIYTDSLVLKDIETIEHLLDEDGVFEIHNTEFEVINSNKYEYLSFLKNLLQENEILSVDYDICLRCKTGNQVVLLNNGTFPLKPNFSWDLEKTGLMFDIKDEKIVLIKYCYQFLHKDNNELSCKIKYIQEIYQEQGYSKMEALRLAMWDAKK